MIFRPLSFVLQENSNTRSGPCARLRYWLLLAFYRLKFWHLITFLLPAFRLSGYISRFWFLLVSSYSFVPSRFIPIPKRGETRSKSWFRRPPTRTVSFILQLSHFQNLSALFENRGKLSSSHSLFSSTEMVLSYLMLSLNFCNDSSIVIRPPRSIGYSSTAPYLAIITF